MSQFFTELWESIFTPGPTPTLLVATNVTFATLQTLLLALLVATYNIHFLALSILSGGLWWAINWFARELRESQRLEREEQAQKGAAAARVRAAAGGSSSSDSETEVETGEAATKKPTTTKISAAAPTSGSREVEPVEAKGELKHRSVAATSGSQGSQPSSSAGTKSGTETEDEWEKVSENENEKDR